MLQLNLPLYEEGEKIIMVYFESHFYIYIILMMSDIFRSLEIQNIFKT